MTKMGEAEFYDFNPVWAYSLPNKTNAPLIIDANAMLALYPLSIWIAVRFIINHRPYFELILAQRTFREFLWRKPARST